MHIQTFIEIHLSHLTFFYSIESFIKFQIYSIQIFCPIKYNNKWMNILLLKTKNKNKNNKKRTFHRIQVKPPSLTFPLIKKSLTFWKRTKICTDVLILKKRKKITAKSWVGPDTRCSWSSHMLPQYKENNVNTTLYDDILDPFLMFLSSSNFLSLSKNLVNTAHAQHALWQFFKNN